MSRSGDLSCGCGPVSHPPPPVLPPGLPTLPRQWAGFVEYREAMLSAVARQTALAGWRARGAHDLGVMLLESWAYVLDVVGFYDARIAERAYLRTAPDERSAQRLTAMLGHRPRPAMAARVTLAAEADGDDPVLLPAGTAFRSEPFDGEPPQVFELANPTRIWPQRNAWQLAPVRGNVFDGTLRFAPRRAPSTGAVLVLRSGTKAAAARVTAVDTETGPDGAVYQRVELDSRTSNGIAALTGVHLDELTTQVLRRALPLSTTASAALQPTTGPDAQGMADVVLDAVYPQLRIGDPVVVEIDGQLHAGQIDAVTRHHSDVLVGAFTTVAAGGNPVVTNSTSKLPASMVRIKSLPALQWGTAFTLHAVPLTLGRATGYAKSEIALDDIVGAVSLVGPVDALGDAPASGVAVARGARRQGALLAGTLHRDGSGDATYMPDAATQPFAATLATPVTVHGNAILAVRGETVVDEVLGSGNAAVAFAEFRLKQKPLAWVEDASQADGRRAELTVRVDGVTWTRVDTLFRRAPDERVYVVRQDGEGAATIRFGDGSTGARPATGVDNVRADYRHGAGAKKPPAGAINQIAVPVPGLGAIRGPLPAVGGSDAETAAELRVTAPRGALTLGRAVSLADLEALARAYSGVLNAAAGWAWDETSQRAAATIWIVADGGDPSADLRNWLALRSAVDLPIAVKPALRHPHDTLAITLAVAADHDPALVRTAVRTALFDSDTGLLAAKNVRIGAPLFRSSLTARLHEVRGVLGVRSILLQGVAMAHGIDPGEGTWFDLMAKASVT